MVHMAGMDLVVDVTQWGSIEYTQSVALRYEVLRKPLGLVFDPSIFSQELHDFHLVAKKGDWVVGCMILTKNGESMKMRQVAVDPQCQRVGIGAKLVAHAERIAIGQETKEIILHARDTALTFYLSLGYEIVGEGFEEVGIPHHAMRKSLID